MVKSNFWLLGYRIVTVNKKDLPLLASRLLRSRIIADIRPDGSVIIKERDFSRLKALPKGLEYRASEPKGVVGAIKRCTNKVATLLAILTSVLITVFLSSMVWDIRVDGNKSLADSYIVEALSDQGLTVGALWRDVDLNEVEIKMLDGCDSVSWISINRRGTVAYVSVMEKEVEEDSVKPFLTEYSNIVATHDCVIEEITVKRGKAAVKVGDVVRKGDLLIQGVDPEEVGGGLCRASGEVIGRISDTVSVNVNREYGKKTLQSERIISLELKILNFCANIFKKDRNSNSDCDIIEEIKVLSLIGKCVLPIEIKIERERLYGHQSAEYSDTELLRIATSRLNAETAVRLSSCDLLRIRTDGKYTDSGYFMYNDLSYTTQVGVEKTLSVENAD